MTRKIIKIYEKMISARELRKRWPGMKLDKIIQGIDDSNNKTDPYISCKKDSMIDFPESFFHIKTIFIDRGDDESDEEIKYCKICEVNYEKNEKYIAPYKKRIKNGKIQYYIVRIIFKISGIEEYEKQNPYVLLPKGEIKNKKLKKKTETYSRYKHYPVKQKDVAALCNVSEATVRNWDNGIRRPIGYPGRSNVLALSAWAKGYNLERFALKEKKNMERALPIDPNSLEKMNKMSVFSDDGFEDESE